MIIAFILESMYSLWLYYITFYIIAIIVCIFFTYFGIKTRRGFTKIIRHFKTYTKKPTNDNKNSNSNNNSSNNKKESKHKQQNSNNLSQASTSDQAALHPTENQLQQQHMNSTIAITSINDNNDNTQTTENRGNTTQTDNNNGDNDNNGNNNVLPVPNSSSNIGQNHSKLINTPHSASDVMQQAPSSHKSQNSNDNLNQVHKSKLKMHVVVERVKSKSNNDADGYNTDSNSNTNTNTNTNTSNNDSNFISPQTSLKSGKKKSKSIKYLRFERRKLDIMILSIFIVILFSFYSVFDLLFVSYDLKNESVYSSPYPNNLSFITHFVLLLAFIYGLTAGLWIKRKTAKDPLYYDYCLPCVTKCTRVCPFIHESGKESKEREEQKQSNQITRQKTKTRSNARDGTDKNKNKNKNSSNANTNGTESDDNGNDTEAKKKNGMKLDKIDTLNLKKQEKNASDELETSSDISTSNSESRNDTDTNDSGNDNNNNKKKTTKSNSKKDRKNKKSKKHKKNSTGKDDEEAKPSFIDDTSNTIRNKLAGERKTTQSNLLKTQTTESHLELNYSSGLSVPTLHVTQESETVVSTSLAYVPNPGNYGNYKKTRNNTGSSGTGSNYGNYHHDHHGGGGSSTGGYATPKLNDTMSAIEEEYEDQDDYKIKMLEEINSAGPNARDPISPVLLDDITMSGKKKGKYDRSKVPRVNKNDEKTKANIKKFGNLSLADQKKIQDQDTHITFIRGRRNTYGSMTMPTVSAMSHLMMSASGSVVSDGTDSDDTQSTGTRKGTTDHLHGKNDNGDKNKDGNNNKHGVSSPTIVSTSTSNAAPMVSDINETKEDMNGKGKNSKDSNNGKLITKQSEANVFENLEQFVGNCKTHVSLIIYELDHVLVTMPEKLNKMDFNNWYLIDQFSLIMTFGGIERINRLREHLTKIYNASINDSTQQQPLVCFVFTRRHSDTVYRILDSVGLIEFFRHFTKFNTELSHVVGFDHRLMQENNFRHHLVLLKLMRFLQKEHNSVLYIGNDKDTIDHLKKINVCQTYLVKTKGMIQTDMDKIERKFFNIQKPKEQ